MPDETPSSSFPATRQDLANLKQTAVDATKDLRSTAAAHAATAKGQLQDLAGHVQEEGGAHLDQAKVKFSDVLGCARDFASERPFVCIGTALAIGLLVGLGSRTTCRN
jgi:ElaB/YqjD/DUF883 family membrane-anchored ribosome-binding protein